MTFHNLYIVHERSADEQQWLEQEMVEQEQRYEIIVKTMDALAPQREIWYAEFLQRIQERGYNVDGDLRAKISLADIPLRPDRPHKVVY